MKLDPNMPNNVLDAMFKDYLSSNNITAFNYQRSNEFLGEEFNKIFTIMFVGLSISSGVSWIFFNTTPLITFITAAIFILCSIALIPMGLIFLATLFELPHNDQYSLSTFHRDHSLSGTLLQHSVPWWRIEQGLKHAIANSKEKDNFMKRQLASATKFLDKEE